MELITIYECLCDRTRLRILHLLGHGPLCVCHFQSVLQEPQVKISKHLAYLRSRKLVQCSRQGQWMVYSVPEEPSRELAANLACLHDCAREDPTFKRDLARLSRLAPASIRPAMEPGRPRPALEPERPRPARRDRNVAAPAARCGCDVRKH